MAPAKLKTKLVAGVAILVVFGNVAVIMSSIGDSSKHGRLRLPVGKSTPAISLGKRHGLILASDGSLWSWGCDFVGWPVLGLGSFTNNSTSLRRIGHETNWVSIQAGADHNLAIKLDGTLWTWGASVRDRAGRNAKLMTAITAPAPAAPGNDWKQAAVGGIHSVALKRNGTLWAWGDNWSGAVGIESTNGSSVPVQVGSATNWIKVWAGICETVAMQSDGSLWYWGENPNPAFKQKEGQIFVPTRVNPDTNWVDVGFGVNTVFAIKSDGTLWTWGRQAHVYTGAIDQTQDIIPTRIGTDCDWQSISSSTGWWCNGLIKKDGSLWLMDASDENPNGPRSPYKPVQFRRVKFQGDYVAYAGGAVHGAAPGVHGPIGVVLKGNGEVWTWGVILGDPPTLKSRFQGVASRLGNLFHLKIQSDEPEPVYREIPWQLRNVEVPR
jgi:alpha-tubulin suppressor-like RCC1 family protein